jgi:hypothetical protein
MRARMFTIKVNNDLLKIPFLLAILCFVVPVCTGQTQLPELIYDKLKGRVRMATHVREYWITGGIAGPPRSVVLGQTEFDEEGKLIRHSHFGNVERRELYTYKDGKRTVEVKYLDSAGQLIPAD